MKSLSIRLVALDLDGTLLNSQKQVSQGNLEALAAAAAAGVQIVPCSGRALDSIPKEVLTAPGVRYVVTSGGGAVYDLQQNRQVLRNPLPVPLILEILAAVRKADEFGECYTGEAAIPQLQDLHWVHKFVSSRDFAFLERRPVENLPEWVRSHPQEVVKMNLMFARPENRQRFSQQLSARPEILLTSAASFNLEVNAVGHGKGDTLCALGQLLGIQPEEMLACGDQMNDVNMLNAVGVGVAMGNAVPELKALAAWQTATNDEDGVARAVERFVLESDAVVCAGV